VSRPSATKVAFAWTEGGAGAVKTASHTYPAKPGVEDATWSLQAGRA
jgi:hypothetical protein